MSDTKQLNIYQKMLQATMNIERVKKDLSVQAGKGSYKAVSEGAVLKAVKEVEIELGIYSYPFTRKIVDSAVLVNSREYNGTITETKQMMMRIETGYRFVNIDNPSDYIDIVSYGDGVDSQDKAPGKAMTYADKYALLKAYKIETGDDPDKDGSAELKSATPTKATEAQLSTIGLSIDGEREKKICAYYKVKDLSDLTTAQASEIISKLTAEKR
jgi:hypothetical protein